MNARFAVTQTDRFTGKSIGIGPIFRSEQAAEEYRQYRQRECHDLSMYSFAVVAQ